jgi:hypothetical protein
LARASLVLTAGAFGAKLRSLTSVQTSTTADAAISVVLILIGSSVALDALRSSRTGVRSGSASVAVRISTTSVGSSRASTAGSHSTRRGLPVRASVARLILLTGAVLTLGALSTAVLVAHIASSGTSRTSSGPGTTYSAGRAAVAEVLAHIRLVVAHGTVVAEPLADIRLIGASRAVTAADFDRVSTLGASTASRPSTARVGALGAVQRQGVACLGRVTSSRVHVAATASSIGVVTALGAGVASSGSARVAALGTVRAAISISVVGVSALAAVASTGCTT